MARLDGGAPVLVTGANGFLGSWVVRKLCAAGRPVRAMVRGASDLRNLDGLLDEITLVRGDKADRRSLEAAVRGCGIVLDCAVDVRTWAPEAELDRTNVTGTRTLLEVAQAAGVQRVVHCSTAGTIGRGAGPLAVEANALEDGSAATPYTRSRVRGEAEVRAAAARGLAACIVNPAVTWGPGDRQPTPQGRLLQTIASGRLRVAIPVRLCVTDIEDAADAMIAAATRGRPGERYLIGGETLWLREIMALVTELSGCRRRCIEVPIAVAYAAAATVSAANGLLRRRSTGFTLRTLQVARSMPCYDNTKARTELGYRPRPAREVFARALAWLAPLTPSAAAEPGALPPRRANGSHTAAPSPREPGPIR